MKKCSKHNWIGIGKAQKCPFCEENNWTKISAKESDKEFLKKLKEESK